MSYDSNTKVSLLTEQFSKLLLFTFSVGFAKGESKLTSLLHNYRGVDSEDNYDEIVNKLVDAFYLTEVSSVYYDGSKLVFGTVGWYKNVNIHFTPKTGKLEVFDGVCLISLALPRALKEYCYMVEDLANDILGKAKDFKAVPTTSGHKLDRKY